MRGANSGGPGGSIRPAPFACVEGGQSPWGGGQNPAAQPKPHFPSVPRGPRRRAFDLRDGTGQANTGFVQRAAAPSVVGSLPVRICGVVESLRLLVMLCCHMPVWML